MHSGILIGLGVALLLCACGDVDQTTEPVDPDFAGKFTAVSVLPHELHQADSRCVEGDGDRSDVEPGSP